MGADLVVVVVLAVLKTGRESITQLAKVSIDH